MTHKFEIGDKVTVGGGDVNARVTKLVHSKQDPEWVLAVKYFEEQYGEWPDYNSPYGGGALYLIKIEDTRRIEPATENEMRGGWL